MSSTFDRYVPHVLSLLRIVAALLFLEHGTQKILGFPAGMNPAAFTLPWVAGVLELVGGALLLVGLSRRPVAFLLSGEMAIGYFLAHAPKAPFQRSTAATRRSCFASFFSISSPSVPARGASTRGCGGPRSEPRTPLAFAKSSF